MPSARSALRDAEIAFFQALNRVVEPRVRKGLGSPRLVPTGLVVLESRGRISGRWRRTPLVATRIGPYVLVSTVRGKRSQWVQNLLAAPGARLWLGGKRRDVHALVLHRGKGGRLPAGSPAALGALLRVLRPITRAGWAFALLMPPALNSARAARAVRRPAGKPRPAPRRRSR